MIKAEEEEEDVSSTLHLASRERRNPYSTFNHARIEAEEEAHILEEARLKYEEDEQARMRADKEACLVEEKRQKAEGHKRAWLKVE